MAGGQGRIPAEHPRERIPLPGALHHEQDRPGRVQHGERQREAIRRRLRSVVDGANRRLPLVQSVAPGKERRSMTILPQPEVNDVEAGTALCIGGQDELRGGE